MTSAAFAGLARVALAFKPSTSRCTAASSRASPSAIWRCPSRARSCLSAIARSCALPLRATRRIASSSCCTAAKFAPSLLTLSSGRLGAALERVDFPAGREKFLFQRDPFGAFARGQLALLVGQDFRRLPGLRRRARFLCRFRACGFKICTLLRAAVARDAAHCIEFLLHRHQVAPSLLTLSSGRLRTALERVDFPAGREKFLFQRDPLTLWRVASSLCLLAKSSAACLARHAALASCAA